MKTALFLNGVFEGVLEEILAAQAKHVRPNFLQPYSPGAIQLLKKLKPSSTTPVTLYLSTTKNLTHVSYVALIVGWRDKRALTAQDKAEYDQQIEVYQPKEAEVYLSANGKPCVNLLFIKDLERLAEPVPVSCLEKKKDHTTLRKRSRAGGWSYVLEAPEWLGRSETYAAADIEEELQEKVSRALQSSAGSRAARLAVANPKPEAIQVLARAFRRNPDVIAEVLIRAAGVCEECGKAAPFLRKSDGSPYLEVHHKRMLADGGDDIVENAIGLCPNCHRQCHHGIKSDETLTLEGGVMMTDEQRQRREHLACSRTILEAGAWLIESGLGNLRLMPYAYATGHWRCEFHIVGKPRKPLFRYSIASKFEFLKAHCGGFISPKASPEELAQAIWVSIPPELKSAAEGPLTDELSEWLTVLRRHLDLGSVPIAFDEYEDWGDWGQQWALIGLSDQSDERRIPAIPGFVMPSEEQSVFEQRLWREGESRAEQLCRHASIGVPGGLLIDDERIHNLGLELYDGAHGIERSDGGRLLKALIGALFEAGQAANART